MKFESLIKNQKADRVEIEDLRDLGQLKGGRLLLAVLDAAMATLREKNEGKLKVAPGNEDFRFKDAELATLKSVRQLPETAGKLLEAHTQGETQ